jgi:hypothetical protein
MPRGLKKPANTIALQPNMLPQPSAHQQNVSLCFFLSKGLTSAVWFVMRNAWLEARKRFTGSCDLSLKIKDMVPLFTPMLCVFDFFRDALSALADGGILDDFRWFVPGVIDLNDLNVADLHATAHLLGSNHHFTDTCRVANCG